VSGVRYRIGWLYSEKGYSSVLRATSQNEIGVTNDSWVLGRHQIIVIFGDIVGLCWLVSILRPFDTRCPQNCVSVDQTLLSYCLVRELPRGSIISRIIHTYKCGSLEPKIQRKGGTFAACQPRVPAALRLHVPQHTGWILSCTLLFPVESTAQANDSNPRSHTRYG
jgi:hypothetical protein